MSEGTIPDSIPIRPVFEYIQVLQRNRAAAQLEYETAEAKADQECAIFLASLRCIDVSTLGLDPKDHECSICQDRYNHPGEPSEPDGNNETPVQLPCGHIMGKDCLESWFCKASSCPECRAQALPNSPRTRTDDDHSDEEMVPIELILSLFRYAIRDYLATNPSDETFGAFKIWLRARRHGQVRDMNVFEVRVEMLRRYKEFIEIVVLNAFALMAY